MESSSGAVNRKLGKEIGDRSFDRIGAVNTKQQRGGVLTPQHLRLVAIATFLVVACLASWITVFGGGSILGGGGVTYTVVFDAGSTGNRVHIFKFQDSPTGPKLLNEVFHAEKPGFRDVAVDAQKAADLLDPLLVTTLNSVPLRARASTKLTLRATAGLRLLPEGADAAQAIMDAVKIKLQATAFVVPDQFVTILDGSDEGAYGWIAVNYLLAKLGKVPGETAAVVDLGGGSSQIMYAVESEVANGAPDGYVRSMGGSGANYDVYVKSFKGYGIMAARAKILQLADPITGTHPCVPAGFEGGCESKCYGLSPGESYRAKAREEGADFDACLTSVRAALMADGECDAPPCSFGGAWTTPRSTTLYGMSYLYERAEQSGAMIAPDDASAPVPITPAAYAAAGAKVCRTHVDKIMAEFPEAEEQHFPYLCLDIAYAYALLTDGFGLEASEEMMLVNKIKYHGQEVEAAWALGDAIAVMEEQNAEMEARTEAADEAAGAEKVLAGGKVETRGTDTEK